MPTKHVCMYVNVYVCAFVCVYDICVYDICVCVSICIYLRNMVSKEIRPKKALRASINMN